MAHWSGTASSRRSQQLLWGCRRLASGGRTASSGRSLTYCSRVKRGVLSIGNGCVPAGIAARGPSMTRTPLPWDYHEITQRHIAGISPKRHYATAPSQSAEPGVTSTTTEHSPGHNVATISVSNPAKLNIVNSALLTELIEKCQDLQKDENLRAVVVTGAPTNPGKAVSFIGGADIKEMIGLSSPAEARAFIDRIHDACEAMRKIPVPVIARVDGFCLGAGMEIAAACDLRVATRSSTFGMPEVKVGIPSVVEAAYLPGLIGMGRTRRLLYLAENIDGLTAERWGFLEEVVEGREELDEVVGKWMGELVGMGPKAIRAQKVLMQGWEEVGVGQGIEMGARAYAESFDDGGVEPREFMGRFVGRKR